jgi:hypothetical protein
VFKDGCEYFLIISGENVAKFLLANHGENGYNFDSFLK